MNKKKLNSRNNNLSKLTIQFIFSIIMCLTFSCNSYKKSSIIQESDRTVKLIIDTNTKIDKLVFTKFGGFTEEDLMPFQDTIIITLNEPINDMFQLLCVREHQNLVEHLWLKGENIIIKASIKEETLSIDTIINAPFYYYTKRVMETYETLIEQKAKREEMNDFLLKAIKQNIDHSFSNILASNFIEHNINQLENLQILASIIDNQKPKIKNHIFSVHENLRQLTEVNTINFLDFKFIDIALQERNITPSKNTIYLLDFWFTSCAPCIEEHKRIHGKLTDFRQSGIEVIGISTDYDQIKWVDFLHTKQYKWDNYKEINEDENTLSKYIGITSFPTYLVVKEDGEILNRNNTIEESITFLKATKILK